MRVVSATAFVFFKFVQMKLLFGRSRPHLLFEQCIYVFHPLTNSLDFSSFPSVGARAAALSHHAEAQGRT
jgi:hypothetical protein